MKITIEFDNEDDALMALKGWKLHSLVGEVDNYCRGLLKHGEIDESVEHHLSQIRELIHRDGAYEV